MERRILKSTTTHQTRPAGRRCPKSFTSSWGVSINLLDNYLLFKMGNFIFKDINLSVFFLQPTMTQSSLNVTTITAQRESTSSRKPSLPLITQSGHVPSRKACWDPAQDWRTRPLATTAPCLVLSLRWTGYVVFMNILLTSAVKPIHKKLDAKYSKMKSYSITATKGKYSVLSFQIIEFLPTNHTELPPYVNCTILVSNICIYLFEQHVFKKNESKVLHIIIYYIYCSDLGSWRTCEIHIKERMTLIDTEQKETCRFLVQVQVKLKTLDHPIMPFFTSLPIINILSPSEALDLMQQLLQVPFFSTCKISWVAL